MRNTAGKKLCVLVVDDDPEAMAFACSTLEGRYTVLTAACGRDAVRIARESKPAAIVLDVIMPENEDGFSVFRTLHGDPATREIPVILLTSVNEMTGLAFGSAEMEQYLGGKPAAFLEKPRSPDELMREVDKAVERRHAG